MEHQEYIYHAVCVNTTEERFYKTWSIIGVYLTCLLFLVVLKRNSYVPWEYIYTVVCVNTTEELFYTTISTLLYVVVLQSSPSIPQGAPVGV